MVQASSFLLLLAFSAVMIQGAPLAARSNEHHNKDNLPTEESKLQMGVAVDSPPQFAGEQASGFGAGGTEIVQAGPPAAPPTCMEPQSPQPASQRGGPVAMQGSPGVPGSREQEERMTDPPTGPPFV
ncbi:hypothetical protein BCR42DRAFT_443324 [Absidia repens]|uniref:Uncharacterized protein n=1 Tax=Absidia repens TaxID=90262 RepID=A0A1X2I026_9FUNG|nr:hypothetical protein BCR42DRAFT_443324 [Absidia repens]